MIWEATILIKQWLVSNNMSKTYRKQYTKNLFHNGEHGPHNTLLREFKGLRCGTVKAARNLLDRRDYHSDRYKRIRKAAGKKRRLYMKKFANEIINEEIF